MSRRNVPKDISFTNHRSLTTHKIPQLLGLYQISNLGRVSDEVIVIVGNAHRGTRREQDNEGY
jgi:hypothetical protein